MKLKLHHRCKLLSLALLATAGALLSQGCATTSQPDPSDAIAAIIDRGYLLGEEVNKIRQYEIDGWQYLSDEAIILPARPRQQYLITFKNSCPGLSFTPVIGFTNTGLSVLSNYDAVIIPERHNRLHEKCFIDHIYTITRADKSEPEAPEATAPTEATEAPDANAPAPADADQ
ncbi:DUF6491 family protein [Halioxenophilus sp. WMMB6]|uniref:DUF6491 family protein n=1 Tax=Halioxenophilus sp. WMMB6 TaxID=3073815 RepID=UPI00295E32D7|nr:DUF6491 family protein [Halioxenophilus sp. WMMB6]